MPTLKSDFKIEQSVPSTRFPLKFITEESCYRAQEIVIF